jgi:hypothetical protein
MSPSPTIIDLLLSEVILSDLAWVPISYVFVYSKSLRPTYFRDLIYKNSGPLQLQPSICQCQWLFLGSPSSRFGHHLSHLIYIYKSKITKYKCICTWSSAPYTVTERFLYIIKGPMKVISGLLPETWGYFCMKNFIFTTPNCHSHIHESTFVCLAQGTPSYFPLHLTCGPPKLVGSEAPPRLTPLPLSLGLLGGI